MTCSTSDWAGYSSVVIADVNEPLTEAYVSGIFAKDTERMLKIFREWPVPLTFCINILYVETGTERILVDSGGGPGQQVMVTC